MTVQAAKKLVGLSSGDALRRMGAGVVATGTLTTKSGETVTCTGHNGDDYESWNLGSKGNLQWVRNNREVAEKKGKGQKIPWPGKDAEVSVLQQIHDRIDEQNLETDGGSLSLSANGTSVCTYCRRLIRAFCNEYGLTWSDDPK